MKSLKNLLVLILQDCGMKCGANPVLDISYVERRIRDEGDSFATITLPSYARGLERALELGRLSPALFPSFRRRKGTCLPRFLGGFMERIFDPDGNVRENASSDCIFAVRQICLFAKKLNLACTSRRNRAAELAYLGCEADLKGHVWDKDTLSHFEKVASIVMCDLVRNIPSGDAFDHFTPRHGPGTTREGVRGNQKFLFPSWPSRLDSEFPYTEFGIGSIRNFDYGQSELPVTLSHPRNEDSVRVVFVPKTLLTPRVIAIEPVCMQYIQQSIAGVLIPLIEKQGSFTSGHVNFTDQGVNARLSRIGSVDRSYATIDMSEASDRVSAFLIWRMLKSVPILRRQVFSCRSTRATLPSGITIPLRKFASMGSALCFPIESLAFFCALVSIRLRSVHHSLVRPRDVFKASRGVYVYGDDFIVPNDEAPSICDSLPAFGLKVNVHKSFWNGNFRESCGLDSFRGVDVTPVYLRREIPSGRSDSHGVASMVSLANQFYLAGLWKVAREIRRESEKILGLLPSISISAFRYLERAIEGRFQSHKQYAGLGWISFSNAESFNGWNKSYQCLKSKRWVICPIRRRDLLTGDAALLKCFGVIGSETISPTHLRESVRYGNLALKRRWISL